MAQLMCEARRHVPGLLISMVVAAAATFLSNHYHAPVMLFALLLGMSLNFLSIEGQCKSGIDFTAREVLRIGIALLGLRITLDQIVSLGWYPVIIVVLSIALTIGLSMLAARLLGFQTLFGFLSGGATAICGASAALAIAAALPAHSGKEKATLFTVIGVSALSTLAMIAYPMLSEYLGLSPLAAGIFIGGTIHDVAQVVGAGYSISPQVGDIATVVKLLRVAMLLPVILCAAWITRQRSNAASDSARPPLLPWFAVAFFVLTALNSTSWIMPSLQRIGNDVSQSCLIIAISAIGLKTKVGELRVVGIKPVLLMIGETLFLAALVLLLITMTPSPYRSALI